MWSLINVLLQPFLDPKVVTDRIMEVIKNFEKVSGVCIHSIDIKLVSDLILCDLCIVFVVSANLFIKSSIWGKIRSTLRS